MLTSVMLLIGQDPTGKFLRRVINRRNISNCKVIDFLPKIITKQFANELTSLYQAEKSSNKAKKSGILIAKFEVLKVLKIKGASHTDYQS
jgi:hypothetical protein